MGKELTTQRSANYVQALYNINAGASSLDGRDILKLSTEGVWSFGQDNTAVDEQKDTFVINPESFREGYVAFDDKNNLAVTIDDRDADFLWPLGQAPSLDEHEDEHPLEQPRNARANKIEYRHQLAIDLVCIEGPNKGASLVYKSTSQGGRKMLGKLAGEIARRKERGDEAYVPAIALWADDYFSRKWNRTIWNPQAEILDWYTLDDNVLKEDAPKEPRDDRKSEPRTTAKADRDDRRGSREKSEDDRSSRGRSRRGGDDRAVEEDGNVVEMRGRRGRDRDGEDVDPGRDERPARGEGHRERPSRDERDPEGVERTERRPARGERRGRR